MIGCELHTQVVKAVCVDSLLGKSLFGPGTQFVKACYRELGRDESSVEYTSRCQNDTPLLRVSFLVFSPLDFLSGPKDHLT